QPAELHLVLDEVDAPPGGAVAGAVGGHQEDAGDELKPEDEGERAAPDVAPAGTARDVFQQHGADELLVTRPVVEPGAKSSKHGDSFATSVREQVFSQPREKAEGGQASISLVG